MSLTTKQLKAIDAYRKCEQGAFSRVRAYTIIKPNSKADSVAYGVIRVAYPKDGAGRLHVFVWDYSSDRGIQHGMSSGYGYDKLSAALQDLQFDDITFTDHPVNWESQLRQAGYTVIQAI